MFSKQINMSKYCVIIVVAVVGCKLLLQVSFIVWWQLHWEIGWNLSASSWFLFFFLYFLSFLQIHIHCQRTEQTPQNIN